jgi:hypothetical protein
MNVRLSVSRGTAIVFAIALMLALVGLQVAAQGESATQMPYPTATLYPTSTPYPTPTPAPSTGLTATAPGTEEPRQSASNVKWSVSDMAFQSKYPKGFSFSVKITSSAGPVVRGRVIWSHAPGTQRSRPITVDPTTGMITAEWDVTAGQAVPPWVGITYYWDVGDSEGNTFQTEPQYVEYEDKGHNWIRTESQDIIVFSENLPDSVNQMSMDAMAQQRETYRAAWGDLLPYKPRAILFGDRPAWDEWHVGATDPHVIGTTSSDWGGTAQVAYQEDLTDLAYGTVPHEVAHLYQAAFTIMPAGDWFIEGNATFFELHQQYDYLASVQLLAAAGELPPLLEGPGPAVSGQNARDGYDIGYTWWKWLVDNYGLDGHRKLIQLLDQGVSRNKAIEEVTGLSISEVESRWRVWLGASAVPPTLIPLPTAPGFPTPTPFTFGG